MNHDIDLHTNKIKSNQIKSNQYYWRKNEKKINWGRRKPFEAVFWNPLLIRSVKQPYLFFFFFIYENAQLKWRFMKPANKLRPATRTSLCYSLWGLTVKNSGEVPGIFSKTLYIIKSPNSTGFVLLTIQWFTLKLKHRWWAWVMCLVFS